MIINEEEFFVTEYFPDPMKKIVYAPLRASVFVVDNSFIEKISNTEDVDVKEFIDYLKTKENIDIQTVLKVQQNEVPNLSISLTNDCNLKCIYCHANAGSPFNNDTFSKKNIDLVIEKYFGLLESNYTDVQDIQLSFMGGGEPTIKFDLMVHAIERCKAETSKRKIKLHIVTATNGCYSKKVANYLIAEFSHISFSFDGPELIQNHHRPFKNGSKSFDISFNNAKYLYTKQKSFSFRSTVSKITIENHKQFIDFFCENFPHTSIGVEPLSKFGRGKQSEIAPTLDEFHEFMQKIEEYSQNKPIEIKNSAIEKLQLIRTYFCRAVSAPSFNVNPAGELWACARENAPDIFLYGKFDFNRNELNIDNDKRMALKNCNVFSFSECKDCISKYHCAGDCPDYRFEKLLRCKTTQMLTAKMLNKIIDN
ncbi:MAG: radical SAM protein [Bacteroidota bacterium]